jgi:hypothetical protein
MYGLHALPEMKLMAMDWSPHEGSAPEAWEARAMDGT